MLDTKESIDFFQSLRKSLSTSRFSGYSKSGTLLDAFAKYLWNSDLCESLYPCFQLLEVAFRNNVHFQIGIAIKDADWILHEHRFLYADEKAAIKASKDSLRDVNCPITEDYLVSEMKFGFWTSLLNSKYETLWHKIIADVFPEMPRISRTRPDVSTLMNEVRRLRNAALHHHSIWHWGDLKKKHEWMRLLIGYMCSPSAAIASHVDRFPAVHASGMADCQKIASKILQSVQTPPTKPTT